MKSKFIKTLAVMCTIITIFSFNGCGTNKANNKEEENTNVKDESSEPMNNNTNNNK